MQESFIKGWNSYDRPNGSVVLENGATWWVSINNVRIPIYNMKYIKVYILNGPRGPKWYTAFPDQANIMVKFLYNSERKRCNSAYNFQKSYRVNGRTFYIYGRCEQFYIATSKKGRGYPISMNPLYIRENQCPEFEKILLMENKKLELCNQVIFLHNKINQLDRPFALLNDENDVQNKNKNKNIKNDKNKDKDSDTSKCIVCAHAQANYAFVPCGHLCICSDCYDEMRSREMTTCPMCRKKYTNCIKIFY